MEALKDATHLYEVERRARHAERPGFRINELQISPSQKVPWHYHSNVGDTFYVLEGKSASSCATPKRKCPSRPAKRTWCRRDARTSWSMVATPLRRSLSCRALASTISSPSRDVRLCRREPILPLLAQVNPGYPCRC